MAFSYDPKDANNTLPAAVYDASIKEVVDTTDDGQPLRSKKGGEAMQKVVFEVYPPTGPNRQMTCWYTAKSGLWQYKKLAAALGQGEAFKAKTFNAANHIGANLRLDLVIEDSAEYGEQNRVNAYLPGNGAGKPVGAAAAPADEDIPF